MLWIIGGWGNRADSPGPAAARLQRSLSRFPDESGKYGQWGYWRRRDVADEDSDLDFEPIAAAGYDLVPVDIANLIELETAIEAVTTRVYKGPRTAPGLNIELARRSIVDRPEAAPARFGYTARVGFVDARRPFNHIALDVDDDTDERSLMRYMSALVDAWQPDHLGAVTEDVKRAQGHMGPQVAVGRLTYVRDGIPVNTNVLGDEVDVTEADGGRYIRVPGTASAPGLEHILEVRRALGYVTD